MILALETVANAPGFWAVIGTIVGGLATKFGKPLLSAIWGLITNRPQAAQNNDANIIVGDQLFKTIKSQGALEAVVNEMRNSTGAILERVEVCIQSSNSTREIVAKHCVDDDNRFKCIFEKLGIPEKDDTSN